MEKGDDTVSRRLLDAIDTLLRGLDEQPPFDSFLRYFEERLGYALAALYFRSMTADNHSLVVTPPGTEIAGSEPEQDFFITYKKLNKPFERVISIRDIEGEGAPDSPYIKRFLEPNRFTDVLFLNVRNPTTFSVRLLVAAREPDGFSDGDRQLLGALAPYMTSAFKSFYHFNYLEAKSHLYDELVSRIGIGEIRLNADGDVIFCNTMAEALLEERHLLICTGGRLRATSDKDDKLLQSALVRYLKDDPLKPSEPIYLHSRHPYDVIGLLIRQLPAQLGKNRQENAVVGVYLGDHTRRLRLLADLLKKLFDFSATEARVAVHLAEGRSATEIAGLLSVSSTTIRTHISHIYAKTGINRQTELTSMLVRTLASGWREESE